MLVNTKKYRLDGKRTLEKRPTNREKWIGKGKIWHWHETGWMDGWLVLVCSIIKHSAKKTEPKHIGCLMALNKCIFGWGWACFPADWLAACDNALNIHFGCWLIRFRLYEQVKNILQFILTIPCCSTLIFILESDPVSNISLPASSPRMNVMVWPDTFTFWEEKNKVKQQQKISTNEQSIETNEIRPRKNIDIVLAGNKTSPNFFG